MIGIDSNVLVRMMINDDPQQEESIRSFLAQRSGDDPAYISAIVLAESVWVLRRRLGIPMAAIASVLRRFLESDDLRFQFGDRLANLLDGPKPPRGDLADHLIAWCAAEAGCARTVTFDKRAGRLVRGLELLA